MSKLSRALKRLKGKPKGKEGPQPAPESSDPARKAEPQPVPVATVTAPKATPQPPPAPVAAAPIAVLQPLPVPTVTAPTTKSQPSPLPTVTAPRATPGHTPQATRQAPKLASKSVSKPAVQRHAGLYSGFTPSIAAVDQPTAKLVYGAKQAASAVLQNPPTSFTDFTNTRSTYARPDDYLDLIPTSSYSSYARPSRYASAKPLGTFHTGGPLGGGLYLSTGGAVGGEVISQTIGSFGEGSVPRTGGSLGEAMGMPSLVQSPGSVRSSQLLRPSAPPDTAGTIPSPLPTLDQITAIIEEEMGKLRKERESAREPLQEYYSRRPSGPPSFAAESRRGPVRAQLVGKVQERAQKYSAATQQPSMFKDEYVDEALYD